MSHATPALLGILGGLGPMSTVCFYEMLTSHTFATSDKEHIDMVISSRATTPDRTAYILGRSDLNPLPVMIEEARKLTAYGADLLAVPCNTAHYFYDALRASVSVPILNIIEETVSLLARMKVRQVGILATEGTVCAGAYHKVCRAHGITAVAPPPEDQKRLNTLIYDTIKSGRRPRAEDLERIGRPLLRNGCERLILGCTELSLIKRDCGLEDYIYVDSTEVLALRTILRCGKTPIGFSDELLTLAAETTTR
ncbi:MAG: amino acid racemase [Clostridia bacterium]|nr:amino acid racemase [Clostridia bacterium]